jgi:hypothetical protein
MKKTSLDVVDILISVVMNSDLLTGPFKITGSLYKNRRPINSDKEDIVVNSLPINHEEIQEGVLNINIYVPNLSLQINGVKDNSQADYARLKQLTAIASELLDEVWDQSGNWTFNIQQDNTFEDSNNQHYQNLRIEFYSPNNN